MEEFRPAHAIESDTALAAALRADDDDALAELIGRYGAPVSSVAAAADEDAADSIAHDVFLQAWRNSSRLEPGAEFGPWLRGLTVRVAHARGFAVDPDRAAEVWAASSSIGALEGERRQAVAQWCQGSAAVDAEDHELNADRARVERKLAGRLDAQHGGLDAQHGGLDAQHGEGGRSDGASDAAAVLRDPVVWTTPPVDLAHRVQGSVEAESTLGSPLGATGEVPAPTGRVSQRLMRTVLIGLLCAFAVLIAMIAVLSAFSGAPRQPDYTVEMTPTGVVADVSGDITVTGSEIGVEIGLDAPSLPRRGGDQNYRGVLVLTDGTQVTVGSFRTGIDVALTGGVSVSDVAEFLVVRSNVGDTGPVAETDVVLKVPNFQR